MRTDYAVLTGAHHTSAASPCQDYCLASDQGATAWALVADGCSQGGRTDLGARAWARAAERVVAAADALLSASLLQDRVLEAAGPMLDLLEFKDGLATLCVLQSDGRRVRASVFGDGVVTVRHTNGSATIYAVEYSQNAPLYLQYLRVPYALAAYEQQFPGQERHLTVRRFDSAGAELGTLVEVASALSPALQLDLDVEHDEMDLVVVCTDGVSSTPAGVEAALSVVALKSTAGEFLRRRVAKLAREWSKVGGMPTDDLAAAGIWLGEERGNG